MNRDRVLVALVLADVILAFSVIGGELAFHWTLPASLRHYTLSRMFSTPSLWNVGLVALWGTSIGSTLLAWVGLLNYWRYAREIYLAGWFTWTLLTVLSGPSVMTSVGAMASMLEAMVGGAILGLVYFSELAARFERPRAQIPSPA
jgi:hypothetical protein